MDTALRIFRRDVARIARNPVALVVALGVIVIPCLYAWINIAANWDPYENTSDVRVAVVNEDVAVEIGDMGSVCAGDMVMEALSENDQIGWTFTDHDQAIEGVRSGEYYAAIVIPPTFTASLANVLQGDTGKAHISYYVNEKANAIAPKVTDTGASTIEEQIDARFVAVVSEVIVERFQGFAEGLLTGADDAVANASTALADIVTTLGQVEDGVGELSDDLAAAGGSLSSAQAAIASLEGSGARIQASVGEASSRLADARTGAHRLAADLGTSLGAGAATLSSVSSRATYDVSALAADLAWAERSVRNAVLQLEDSLTDTQAMTASLEGMRSLVASISPAGEDEEALRMDLEQRLDAQIGVMVQLSDDQAARLDELRGLLQRLEDGSARVQGLSSDVNDDLQAAAALLANAQVTLSTTTLAQVDSALDGFSSAASGLAAAAGAIDPVVEQSAALVGQLAGTLEGATGALAGTRASLATTASDLSGLSADLSALRVSEAWQLLSGVLDISPEGVSDFMSAPVETVTHSLYPVENYASGVAPFFTSLSLWVGGIALVAIFKLEVDDEGVGQARPWQAYFGRWMLFVCMGLLQAVACVTGDLLIGIQCLHPWALYLGAMVASFSYVNVIFALSVAFKHVGKALAFTMIILQVPGSSGTYPIEMMPAFFQAICPWLPFTYGNNAMREAIAGLYGANLAKDLAMLLAFVVPSLLVGVTARSHLVNINALFDRRLRETDLMVAERVDASRTRFRLATVVKAMEAPEEYRAEFDEVASDFEALYPAFVRRGLLALLVVPAVLFCLMLLTSAKLPLLACWVVSLVAIITFLIVVEYFHDRVAEKRRLTDLSPVELEEVLNESLREELLPFAPIDALLERQAQRQEASPLAHAAAHFATNASRTRGGDAR